MNKLLEQAHPTTKIPSTALSKTLRPSTAPLLFKAQCLDPNKAKISSTTYKHKPVQKVVNQRAQHDAETKAAIILGSCT